MSWSSAPRFGTADEFRQRGVIVRTNGLDPIARSAPERWFTGGFAAAQPAITEWAVQMVRTTDPGCYIAACEALASFDVRAELASVFLMAERGIPHNPDSHAAYLGSWLKILRDDKHEIFRAARDAHRAADLLLADLVLKERGFGELLNP